MDDEAEEVGCSTEEGEDLESGHFDEDLGAMMKVNNLLEAIAELDPKWRMFTVQQLLHDHADEHSVDEGIAIAAHTAVAAYFGVEPNGDKVLRKQFKAQSEKLSEFGRGVRRSRKGGRTEDEATAIRNLSRTIRVLDDPIYRGQPTEQRAEFLTRWIEVDRPKSAKRRCKTIDVNAVNKVLCNKRYRHARRLLEIATLAGVIDPELGFGTRRDKIYEALKS